MMTPEEVRTTWRCPECHTSGYFDRKADEDPARVQDRARSDHYRQSPYCRSSADSLRVRMKAPVHK